jgi:tetratricopeptide (TPR) repeat protein
MDALVELHDQAIRFLRDDGQRLLHVITTATRRGAVLAVLRGLEHGPWTPGPVVVLEAGHGAADPGWTARGELLRRQHGARRAAGAEAGESWPLLGPSPPTEKGLAGFAEQLGQVVDATPGGRGWVVVLAPVHVKAAPQWSRAIAMLLRGTALGRVRWVVVDVDQPTLVDAVAAEHELRRVRCMGEGGEGADGLAGMLAGIGGGTPGARAAGVTAPPRRGRPPAAADDRDAPQRRELARLLLAAGQAQRAGQAASAVELQRQARDLCAAAGWRDAAVQMELVLGGYLLGAGAGEQAVESARRAVQAAAAQPRAELSAIGQLALGSMLVARGDRPAAMLAYAEAVASAERAGATALVLEACRLTGDAAVLLGMEAQAIAFWSRAVKLAEAEPLHGVLGSAGHCARAMALLCRKRGLQEAAQRHWEAARRLEGIDVEALRAASEPERATIPASRTKITASRTKITASRVEEPASRVEEPATPLPRAAAPAPPEEPAFVPFAPSGPTAPFAGAIAEPPLLAAIEEGTADLSLEELAAIHWQGMLPGSDASATPPTVIHHWTAAEQDAIRRATEAVMTDDTTSLLTREEIFALHGQAELPPARQASPAATAMLERATAVAMLRATDPEAEGTAWIPADELASIRTRFGRTLAADAPPPIAPPSPAPPVPEPRPLPELLDGPGDTTSMLTRERLAELARQHALRRKGSDG